METTNTMNSDSLENFQLRILQSHQRIQNLYNLLQQEFIEVKDLEKSILSWEKNQVENGENSHHITGRKCGCGKIHPYRAITRDHS